MSLGVRRHVAGQPWVPPWRLYALKSFICNDAFWSFPKWSFPPQLFCELSILYHNQPVTRWGNWFQLWIESWHPSVYTDKCSLEQPLRCLVFKPLCFRPCRKRGSDPDAGDWWASFWGQITPMVSPLVSKWIRNIMNKKYKRVWRGKLFHPK